MIIRVGLEENPERIKEESLSRRGTREAEERPRQKKNLLMEERER